MKRGKRVRRTRKLAPASLAVERPAIGSPAMRQRPAGYVAKPDMEAERYDAVEQATAERVRGEARYARAQEILRGKKYPEHWVGSVSAIANSHAVFQRKLRLPSRRKRRR